MIEFDPIESDAAKRGRIASARGRRREKELENKLGDEGWCVGSRRHVGGAGDLIACRQDRGKRPGALPLKQRAPIVWLIEVKSTSKPYERFGPEAREELRETAKRAGAEAVLAHWPLGAPLHLIFASSWPK